MYVELRPVYCSASGFSEDVTETITIKDGSGNVVNITGWTFAPHLYAPSGVELVGAITATVTNASAGIVQLTISGQTLIPGEYGFTLTRTDTNSRTFNDTGLLEVTQYPGWAVDAFSTPPASWEAILNRAGEMLSTIGGNLPGQFAGLSSEGAKRAWIDIFMHFVDQGYAQANILACDNLRHWTIEHGAVMAIMSSTALSDYDTASLLKFDPIGMGEDNKPKKLFLTQGGNPVAPAANESSIGGVSFGQIQAVDWLKQRQRSYGY